MELQNIADILTASEASKTAFVWGIVDNEHQQPTTSKMVFALRANNRAVKNGAPNWIRTSGPQIRNLMLYPAELWVHRKWP